jgi:hypothetical protein
MVMAFVTQYRPNRPTVARDAAPAAGAASAAAPLAAPPQRLGLIKRFVPFRI